MKGSDDASNFDMIEEEINLDTDNLKDKKNYVHLPFIGFTFTSDKVTILKKASHFKV